jgi:anti-sigma factor RsiW
LNPNIDKQEMKNYLLGTLDAERRAALEESILGDDGVYEELLVTEAELIDQYLGNNLSPSERNQFETNFLNTAERQRNLQFGRLLRRYLNSQPAPVSPAEIPVAVRQTELPAPAKNFVPFVGGTFARTATLAVSAAVIVSIGIILLTCWFATRNPQQRVVQEDSSQTVPVALTPGTLRSEDAGTQRVQVPPRGARVRLEMQVSNENFHNYKSELFRENASLQTADELRAEKKGEQRIVPWTITGEVLSPGDYQVRLKGVLDSGHDEFIDNYSFRVVK